MPGGSRRYHYKSRKGCLECKRRHVKCDEVRPICINCQVSQRQCEYANRAAAAPAEKAIQLYCKTINLHEAISPSVDAMSSPEASLAATAPAAQLFHMRLWHHVEQSMNDWLMVTDEMKPFAQAHLSYALTTPYLMDQLLALSALHLSIVTPGASESNRYQATVLQTRALTLFNQDHEQLSVQSVTSSFLFSSLLAVQVLAEKLTNHREDFGLFLAGLTQYFRLHQGAKVVGENLWSMLRQSELSDWISRAGSLEDVTEDFPNDWESLNEMLSWSDLNEKSIEACQQAVRALKFVRYRLEGSNSWGVHALMAWSSLISTDFVQLLTKQNLEALVILAHYAILFHRYRDFWIFGDAGEYLILSISQSLGIFGKKWLAGPLEALSMDAQS